MALTLANLRTLSWDWLDDSNGAYFTQTVLNMRLNLAQIECQKRLISANQQWYVKCVNTSTVVSQNAYAVPSDFLEVIRLDYVTQGSGTTASTQKLMMITPNQVDLVTDVQGDPQFYYLQNQNLIMLVPTPSRIITLDLKYAYRVADMSADSDLPDIPAQFHEYLAVLATRDCLIKDGRPLTPIEAKLQHYELLFKQLAVQRTADGARMTTTTGFLDG